MPPNGAAWISHADTLCASTMHGSHTPTHCVHSSNSTRSSTSESSLPQPFRPDSARCPSSSHPMPTTWRGTALITQRKRHIQTTRHHTHNTAEDYDNLTSHRLRRSCSRYDNLAATASNDLATAHQLTTPNLRTTGCELRAKGYERRITKLAGKSSCVCLKKIFQLVSTSSFEGKLVLVTGKQERSETISKP